jgi:putative membrane protein
VWHRREPLRDVGEEPDVRFTYANERTFLAWSRTSLALVATGIAATSLLPRFEGLPGGRRIIGLPLIGLGAVLAIASYVQWYRNQRAMRLGEPLRQGNLSIVLAIGIAVVSVIAVVVVLVGD